MHIDTLGLVSDAQALTATAVCTDKVDTHAVTPIREIGTGNPLGFGISVDVAADFTTGDETYQFDIVSDTDAALGSPTVHASFVLTAAQLPLAKTWFLPLPPGMPTERFLGLRYTLGGTTPLLTVTAWLTTLSAFAQEPVSYAKGYTN